MRNQKEAVYAAITAVFADAEKTIEENTKIALSKEEKAAVISMVVEGFKAGDVSMSEQAQAKYLNQADDKALRHYTDGLVNNWVNKDKRLNGNVSYEAKNPGSRAGSGDSQVRELKKLEKLMIAEGNHEAAGDVREAIEQRLCEIKADKVKNTIEINAELIPEALRQFIPGNEDTSDESYDSDDSVDAEDFLTDDESDETSDE